MVVWSYMDAFAKKCPQCGNEGTAEAKDGRNMFRCYYCGLNTTLINLKYYENGKSTDDQAPGNDAQQNG